MSLLDEYRSRAITDAEELAALRAQRDELVRVLLAVEWKLRTWCPSCEEYEEHGPDCSLDAALRKAGCR